MEDFPIDRNGRRWDQIVTPRISQNSGTIDGNRSREDESSQVKSRRGGGGERESGNKQAGSSIVARGGGGSWAEWGVPSGEAEGGEVAGSIPGRPPDGLLRVLLRGGGRLLYHSVPHSPRRRHWRCPLGSLPRPFMAELMRPRTTGGGGASTSPRPCGAPSPAGPHRIPSGKILEPKDAIHRLNGRLFPGPGAAR